MDIQNICKNIRWAVSKGASVIMLDPHALNTLLLRAQHPKFPSHVSTLCKTHMLRAEELIELVEYLERKSTLGVTTCEHPLRSSSRGKLTLVVNNR